MPRSNLKIEIPPNARSFVSRLSAQEVIRAVEEPFLKTDLPTIYVGDTVRVSVLIKEGSKERLQPYEGTVIAMRHGGINETITVRRIFQGVGVERVFLLQAPRIGSIKVLRRGKARRAKLYYLRERVGKATRLKQRFDRPIDSRVSMSKSKDNSRKADVLKITELTKFTEKDIDSGESVKDVPIVKLADLKKKSK